MSITLSIYRIHFILNYVAVGLFFRNSLMSMLLFAFASICNLVIISEKTTGVMKITIKQIASQRNIKARQ